MEKAALERLGGKNPLKPGGPRWPVGPWPELEPRSGLPASQPSQPACAEQPAANPHLHARRMRHGAANAALARAGDQSGCGMPRNSRKVKVL